jgi:RimJ/RimL family protein N-acetyltransferase
VSAWPRSVRLKDGGEVVVRPLRPDDGPRLEDAFRRLSHRSRLQRFLALVNVLSPATVRYLTCVDGHDHVALGAFDPALEGAPLVGVARCIRLAEAPETGEVAVTVVDSHQGRGLGTRLLELLNEAARAEGFRTYRAYVLADNLPMIEVFRKAGGRVSEADPDEGTVWLDVPVPGAGEPLDGSLAARTIAAAARDEVEARHPPARG